MSGGAAPALAHGRAPSRRLGGRGGMRTASLPRCSGTVVLHRGDAVTCSRGTCPKDLSKAVWLSLHWRFVRCVEVLGHGGDCLDCGFAPSTHQSVPAVL